jgi:hypothetical protein
MLCRLLGHPWVVPAVALAAGFAFWSASARPPHTVYVGLGLVLVGALGALVALGLARGALVYTVCALLAPLVPIATGHLARWMLTLHGELPAVSTSVGYTAFSGYSKEVEFRAFAATIALAAALGGVVGAVLRRVRQRDRPEASPAPPQRRWLLAAAIAAYAVGAFPDIAYGADSLLHARHTGESWDSNNVLVWRWLMFEGHVPLRDFWYPYVGMHWEFSWSPWDAVRYHVHMILVYGVMLTSTHVLVDRRWPWTVGVLGSVLVLEQAQVLSETNRNLTALAVVLAVLALRRLDPPERWPFLLLGAFMAYVVSVEPSQLAAAMVPVGALVAADLLDRQARARTVRRLAHAGAAFTLLLVAHAALLATRGQLTGVVRFWMHVGDMAAYSALPTGMLRWHQFLPDMENLVLIGTHLLVALGAFLTLARRRAAGTTALALGLLAVMLFQKQLVRPHMANQLLGVVLVGVLLVLADWSRQWSAAQRAVAGFAAGAFLGAYQSSALSLMQTLATGPVRAARALPVLAATAAGDGGLLRAHFAPERFTDRNFPMLAALLRGAAGGRTPSIFVLGEDALLYVYLGQPPPPYISFYDASSIGAQRLVVAWLEQTRPEFVVWDPRDREFDSVPNTVRSPLVFEAVIRGYQPLAPSGPYQVLRRRSPAEPLDFAFWKQHLGGRVDLGHVPALSTAGRLDDCVFDVCHDVLRIDLPAVSVDVQRRVGFVVDGEPVDIIFWQTPGPTRYQLDLHRLWFWGPFEGLPRVLSADNWPEMKLELLRKRPDPQVLY